VIRKYTLELIRRRKGSGLRGHRLAHTPISASGLPDDFPPEVDHSPVLADQWRGSAQPGWEQAPLAAWGDRPDRLILPPLSGDQALQ
jgi:hypothetical protein